MEKITDEQLRELLTKKDVKDEVNTIETQKDEVNTVDIQEEIIPEPEILNIEEETIQDKLEEDLNFNTIPDSVEPDYEERPLDPVLKERNNLTIGLTADDIKALFDYIAGKSEKPEFVDRFMADAEGRLREMTSIMTLVQLSQLPILTAYRGQVLERLFEPSNLYDMDSKTLTATLTNLNKDITGILDSSLRNIQATSQFGSLTNEYRKILDGMLMLPKDKLDKIEELVYEDSEKN